jgi:hypothetical protein
LLNDRLLLQVTALLAAGLGVQSLQGPFSDVMASSVPRGSFLYRWLDYLSFALSGLPADATQAAAVVYTCGDLHRPGASLDYPVGESPCSHTSISSNTVRTSVVLLTAQ